MFISRLLHGKQDLTTRRNDALSINMEMIPNLSQAEESSLVEVTDSSVLSCISLLIPKLFESGTAVATAIKSCNTYSAVIPKGMELAKSNDIPGAFRALCHDANGKIVAQANLVKQSGTAVANIASAGINVVGMLASQYYMHQIKNKLSQIGDGIDKISRFQDNEYKSKVFTLVTQVKKLAAFQFEILDNRELRTHEIEHLNKLEDECAQLLAQANLMLSDYCKKNNLEYSSYEKAIRQSKSWYEYQQTLLTLLHSITDLKYVLYLGKVSREQCGALLPVYTRQVDDTNNRLRDWHSQNVKRLEINIDKGKRKRDGIDYFVHWIPGLFNGKNNFRSVAGDTLDIIETQTNRNADNLGLTNDSLYDSDARLISKNGKIYYLPIGH